MEQVDNQGFVHADNGATCTFFTARDGGVAIIDLQDMAGNPITSVSADAFGGIAPFMGPADGTSKMWVSAGGSSRQLITATDIPDRLGALEEEATSTVMFLRGVLGSRPAASAAQGVMYQVTDDVTQPTYISDGTTWWKTGIANRLIDRVAQLIGAQSITTTAMTTWPGVYLNVPVVDSDVELILQFPYRIYQNGVTASTPATVTLSAQIIDDIGGTFNFPVLAIRALSGTAPSDPNAIAEGIFLERIFIDKRLAAHWYQVQFQVSRSDMSIAIDPTFAGPEGLVLEALAVN